MIIGRVLGGIISNIDLDIILHWEALLSVHIKEYHFINNKHKLLGKKLHLNTNEANTAEFLNPGD